VGIKDYENDKLTYCLVRLQPTTLSWKPTRLTVRQKPVPVKRISVYARFGK